MPKRSKFIFSHPDFTCYAGPSVKESHLVGTNALMDLQNKLNTIGMESHQSPKINLILVLLKRSGVEVHHGTGSSVDGSAVGAAFI